MAKLVKYLILKPLHLHKKVEHRGRSLKFQSRRDGKQNLGSSPTNQSSPTSKPQVHQKTLL